MVISLIFTTAWTPRFVDITSCDFWLWILLKDNIYHKRLACMPDLEHNGWHKALHNLADSLQSVVKNMVLYL